MAQLSLDGGAAPKARQRHARSSSDGVAVLSRGISSSSKGVVETVGSVGRSLKSFGAQMVFRPQVVAGDEAAVGFHVDDESEECCHLVMVGIGGLGDRCP